MIRVLLAFFLSMFGVPLPLRVGVLAPKRSKKLNLTGWPFALRSTMLAEVWITGRLNVVAEVTDGGSNNGCLVVLIKLRLRRRMKIVQITA